MTKESSSVHDWDFDAGKLPLDFANTAEWHASKQPREMLKSYSDLVDWAVNADLLSEEEGRNLLAGATANPIAASSAFKSAIELREALFRIFSAIAQDEQPAEMDISLLNQVLLEAMARMEIVPTSNRFAWNWVADQDSYNRMLWPVARSSAELLTSEDVARVGMCEDDRGCGYLFYDTSRNRSRRWCSMEGCGNRAKAQRHYQRRSQKGKTTKN